MRNYNLLEELLENNGSDYNTFFKVSAVSNKWIVQKEIKIENTIVS